MEKKLSKSRKNFQNREKKIGIQKNISGSKKEKYFERREKISESRKIFQNRKNYFKIDKNVSESRNILLQESIKNLWN